MRGSKKHRSKMFDAMLGRSLPLQGRDPKGRTPLRGKCGSHPVKHDPRCHLWNFFPPGFHSSHPSNGSLRSPPLRRPTKSEAPSGC